MFAKLIGRLIRPAKAPATAAVALAQQLDAAFTLVREGDKHAAIIALRACLVHDPFNVAVLNDLAACLSDTGDEAGARETFALAYSLDDSFMPAVVNHAKMLADQRQSEEALSFLKRAKLIEPHSAGADIVYANICHQRGQLGPALKFQLEAWLRSFDNLRFANGYLFHGSYADVDEKHTAAEHRFWAETLKPPTDTPTSPEPAANARERAADRPPGIDAGPRRIRIGYWSPDFRAHSVRFFFRPLLNHHDRTRFEVFVYHDFPSRDAQTQLIEDAAEHFFEVYQQSNDELVALMRSHRLDILVDLAGHSSHNRIPLFQQRMAGLQINALGYPPTTGLAAMDAKLIDRHVSTPDDASYYAEKPLVLESSFWCFDPMEEVPLPEPPPVIRHGFITFGCVGNISKISDRILRCWRQILARVPDSRLLLRALNFEDPVAEDITRERLSAAGIDTARVDLRKPEGGQRFFTSYNEIDLILDTFPFNGGTTTCFATYMGVPVISWAGQSLVSRMGLSILSNLGAPEWVSTDEAAYVEAAVRLARDVDAIADFKRTARTRFRASPLGNGERFAREFERACEARLQEQHDGTPPYRHRIPALPAEELVRRASVAFSHNPPDAAKRIVAHCLENHPDTASAHLLLAQITAAEQGLQAGADQLALRLAHSSGADRTAVLITLARYALMMEQPGQCAAHLDALQATGVADRIDALQAALYRACTLPAEAAPTGDAAAPMSFLVLIPCDSVDRFTVMRAEMEACVRKPANWTVSYQRCPESQRRAAYAQAAQRTDIDCIVIAQKNVSLHGPGFLQSLQHSLGPADIVGFAGAKRWDRLDWNAERFADKAAGYTVASSEKPGFCEVQVFGPGSGPLVEGMAVLDGSLLAVKRARWPALEMDDELLGAEFLMETRWTHSAAAQGYRLAVHRALGVFVDPGISWDIKQRAAGREYLAEKLQFDPFSIERVDALALTAPVPTREAAAAALSRFFAVIPQWVDDTAAHDTSTPREAA